MKELPITESSNAKSSDIDVQTPDNIIGILAACEAEIFGGYNNSSGLWEEEVKAKCVGVSLAIQTAISQHGSTNVVLVGAGTSGRLCRLIAKMLEPIYRDKIHIIPIIAGGIKALVRSQPNTEDSFQVGADDFLQSTRAVDRSNCLTIGVSCGLSANYVKGAVTCAVANGGYRTVVIGFNPADQSTINMCQHGDGITLINPLLGPEAIVGSVRMKGGTATLILLYALITGSAVSEPASTQHYAQVIEEAQAALARLKGISGQIAEVLQKGSRTIRLGGKIHILGSSLFGPLCIYDAAECPPTFGTLPEQVNGYSENGITDLVYYDFEPHEQLPKPISMSVFVSDMLPTLPSSDFIVIITSCDDEPHLAFQTVSSSGHQVAWITVGNRSTALDQIFPPNQRNSLVIESLFQWGSLFQQIIFVRSLLLQLSTGIFTLSGKVFENKMIDLRITNKKLYARAIRIASQITQSPEAVAQAALLNVIYEGDDSRAESVDEHILIASNRAGVVPKTILYLLYPTKSLEEINLMLLNEPVIRKLIVRELKGLNLATRYSSSCL